MQYDAELMAAILLRSLGESRGEVQLGAHNKHRDDLSITLSFQFKYMVFLKSFNEAKRGV